MNMRKELSLLGLAAKAGKIVSGEFATENAVKAGKAFLVLTAEDASDNTKKKFRDMCTFYQVPFYSIGTKEELGSGTPGVTKSFSRSTPFFMFFRQVSLISSAPQWGLPI